MTQHNRETLLADSSGAMLTDKEYGALYAEHCQICLESGPSASLSKASLNRLRVAARDRRRHYSRVAEQLFGEI